MPEFRRAAQSMAENPGLRATLDRLTGCRAVAEEDCMRDFGGLVVDGGGLSELVGSGRGLRPDAGTDRVGIGGLRFT